MFVFKQNKIKTNKCNDGLELDLQHDKKGTILKGKFKKGQMHGKFKKVFPNGSIMDCIFVNGVCTKGKWKNDKKWTLFK